MKRFYILFVLVISFCFLHSQEDIAIDNLQIDKYLKENMYYIFDKNIHTLQLYCEGVEWSQPKIELNSSEQLICSFDDFEGIAKDYRYTLIHCDPTWQPTEGIIRSDYLTGYYIEEYIRDYSQSLNTLRDYTHYSFKFPNENMNFSYSGNYALLVYENNIDNLKFIARFYVFENTVRVPIKVGYSRMPDHLNWIQKVNFNINCGSSLVKEPFRSLNVMIQQNDRPFDIQGGVQPKSMSNTEIYYDFDDKFEFQGNNEFRHVDLRSLKFLTADVSSINVENAEYYVNTHLIEPHKNKVYQKYNDIDGKYFIYVYDSDNPDVEGEYAYVRLHINGRTPMPNEDLYVCGDFNGWQINDDNKMTYNYDIGEYEITLYLKQGYYNYTFIKKDSRTGLLDASFIDGSYSETQNRYSVYIYYQPLGERYCRLIGYNIVNSNKFFGL